MPYPTAIAESVKKVEATRSERLQQTFPRMAPEERQQILETFHPDYIQEAFHELRLGANKGQRAPVELVDALQAPAAAGGDHHSLRLDAHPAPGVQVLQQRTGCLPVLV